MDKHGIYIYICIYGIAPRCPGSIGLDAGDLDVAVAAILPGAAGACHSVMFYGKWQWDASDAVIDLVKYVNPC